MLARQDTTGQRRGLALAALRSLGGTHSAEEVGESCGLSPQEAGHLLAALCREGAGVTLKLHRGDRYYRAEEPSA